MDYVFSGVTYACVMYFAAYNIRDWLRPSIMFYVGSMTNDDDLARRGRAPWWLNRLARKRLRNSEGGTPLTIEVNEKIMRSTRRRLRLYVGCVRIVMYASPLMLVALPIKIALQLRVQEYDGWSIFISILDMFWMYLAWQEIKDNGPWWKRKRDRVLEKVKQTLDGRLEVVPVRSGA